MQAFFSKAMPAEVNRQSCSGCSACFSKPIEGMPKKIQESLEGIRSNLAEARRLYLEGNLQGARKSADGAKRLVSELSSSGNFGSYVDNMFAAHVPEPEIQRFIAGA